MNAPRVVLSGPLTGLAACGWQQALLELRAACRIAVTWLLLAGLLHAGLPDLDRRIRVAGHVGLAPGREERDFGILDFHDTFTVVLPFPVRRTVTHGLGMKLSYLPLRRLTEISATTQTGFH